MGSKLSFNIYGMLALVVFTLFTLTAAALYPLHYNPLYDWLSNLGVEKLNHSGAMYFNLGCIITGLILIPFFITLRRWGHVQNWSKIILVLGIFLGIIASISLIGVGVFPVTNFQMHSITAFGVFNTLFFIILLLNLALFKHPKFINYVGYWGVIAAFITLTFQIMLLLRQNKDIFATINTTVPLPGMEWAAIFSFLVWVALLSYNMWKKDI